VDFFGLALAKHPNEFVADTTEETIENNEQWNPGCYFSHGQKETCGSLKRG